MAEKTLRKPEFTTIDRLARGRSGYNIYAKVISAEHSQIDTKDGQKIPMVNAVIADETAAARAFFKGENAALIKVGNVIAIRNGVKKIIKKNISLEVDLFGRVTPQTKEIKEKTDVNISDEEINIERRDNRDNRNRGRPQGRRPFNNRNQGQRRNFNRNRNDRDEKDGNRNDRPPRRNENRENRDNRDSNRDRKDRPNRPNRGDLDYNRNDTKGQSFEEKKPRRFQEKRGERIPMTKINEIDPGTDGLRFIAKVLSADLVKGKNYNNFRCVLGDQTATVNAFLSENEHIVVGKTIALFNAEAKVNKEHIEIQRAKVEEAKKSIDKVNEKLNISDKAWVPIE